jgi:hypothetical protein
MIEVLSPLVRFGHNDFGPQILFLGSGGFFCLFDPLKYIFSSCMQNSRSMDISHDCTDFGPQIPILGPKFRFWALKAHFCLFDPKKNIFLAPCKIPDRWIDILHDHTNSGTQIPFLGSKGQFCHFRPLKVYIFFKIYLLLEKKEPTKKLVTLDFKSK